MWVHRCLVQALVFEDRWGEIESLGQSDKNVELCAGVDTSDVPRLLCVRDTIVYVSVYTVIYHIMRFNALPGGRHF